MRLRVLSFILATTSLVLAQELELNVVITRPISVEIDKEASFSVTLSSALPAVEGGCNWSSGLRSFTTDFNSNQVFDDKGEAVPGWTSTPDPEMRTCQITIDKVSADDVGEWSCQVNHGPAQAFHKATFQLFANDHQHDVRLPRHVIPDVYEIQMIPIIEEANFTTLGSMQLHFHFTKDDEHPANNKRIVLHSKETLIKESTVDVSNPFHHIDVLGHEYDLEREFYIIHLAEDMKEETFLHDYTISMEFVSILNDKLAGFYRSKYVDEATQETKYLAVTQFESTDARRAFPCLDEPDMKAAFVASIGRKPSMSAESNMPIQYNTTLDEPAGYVLDTFERSDKMSTYLLAFVVADFSYTTSPNESTFNIWHIPSKANQAGLAADVGPKVLHFYEDYFDIDYPLPKMDMVAIPDFEAGAMENWGLITYREATLLYDETWSSLADKEKVVLVIAHELAHQWFGNLVTMKWWTDLWLNEGFATYVECIGTSYILPDNLYRERALLFDLQHVMYEDALETSFALSNQVDNPDYDLVFGSISYDKGDSIIRMMENFLTTDTFNRGLNRYLTRQDHGNADRVDLWIAMNEVAHEDQVIPAQLNVSTIMESWTQQPGYPVVTVTSVEGKQLNLEQKQFFINPTATPSDSLWYVPINVAYPSESFQNTLAQMWMKGQENIDMTVDHFPYILNVKETGYYRVNYDLENWATLTEVLHHHHWDIDSLNRAQMSDDSLNLARAGQLDYSVALELIKYLEHEMEYIPLQAGLNGLNYLDLMYRKEEENYEFLKTFVVRLLMSNYHDVGFDLKPDDTYPIVLKRSSLIDWMCLYGLNDCVDQAKGLFQTWMDSTEPDQANIIPPDLKNSVFKVAIREGGQAEFDFLLARLPNVNVDSDVTKVINGLSHSQDVTNINHLLNMTIDETSPIRSQDTRYVYRAVGTTVVGRRAQFDWLKANLDAIADYYQSLYPTMVKEMLSGFSSDANTPEEIAELEEFLEMHRLELGSSAIAIEQGINIARINAEWMKANHDDVLDWLILETSQETTTIASSTTTASNVPPTTSSCSVLSPATFLLALIVTFLHSMHAGRLLF